MRILTAHATITNADATTCRAFSLGAVFITMVWQITQRVMIVYDSRRVQPRPSKAISVYCYGRVITLAGVFQEPVPQDRSPAGLPSREEVPGQEIHPLLRLQESDTQAVQGQQEGKRGEVSGGLRRLEQSRYRRLHPGGACRPCESP